MVPTLVTITRLISDAMIHRIADLNHALMIRFRPVKDSGFVTLLLKCVLTGISTSLFSMVVITALGETTTRLAIHWALRLCNYKVTV